MNEALVELETMRGYILAEITERADDVRFVEASDLVDELERLKRTTDEAIRMLNDERLRQLEASGARQIGNRVYARVKERVDRYDHDRIAVEAIDQAVAAATDLDTGEVNPRLAADAAVRTMQRIYLSASTKAKVSVLDALGLDRKEYRTREFKKWKLSVTDIDDGDDDE